MAKRTYRIQALVPVYTLVKASSRRDALEQAQARKVLQGCAPRPDLAWRLDGGDLEALAVQESLTYAGGMKSQKQARPRPIDSICPACSAAAQAIDREQA